MNLALTTGQKLIVGGVAAVLGIAAYWKFAEAQPFVAGLGLGAGAVIFGPAVYDWAFEAAERVKRRIPAPPVAPPVAPPLAVAYSRP